MGDLWNILWPALAITGLRTTDVTLNVFKTISIVRGQRRLAAVLQGAESAVWLAAAGIVFSDMTPIRAAGFVIGVMLGTVVGMNVIRKLQLGMVTVRIYAAVGSAGSSDPEPETDDATGVLRRPRMVQNALHDAGFRATTFRGEGRDGDVEMILATVRRKDAMAVMELARQIAPDAFVSVDNDLYPANAADPSGTRA